MKYGMLICVVLLLAACSPAGNQIEAITAIPDSELITSTQPPEAASTQTVITTLTATPPVDKDLPTSLPLNTSVAMGSAMQVAAATDMAMQPTPRNAIAFEQFPVPLTFDEFYDGYNLRTGLILSDKLLSLDGQNVVMEGYMAPPLKPELDYFVITRVRLSFCPFCSTAADWPDDIALVYLPEQTTNATQYPVRISGRMEVGASVDQETGMVSLVRIYANSLEVLN